MAGAVALLVPLASIDSNGRITLQREQLLCFSPSPATGFIREVAYQREREG
jgi:hypothetical protein